MSGNALEITLRVENFKSIKSAELRLRPVTVFIGPPDSGKSNTLEALGLFTLLCYGGDFTQYFRTKTLYGVTTYFGSSSEISITLPCLDPDIAAYSKQLVVRAHINAERYRCVCEVYVENTLGGLLGGLIWGLTEPGPREEGWGLRRHGFIMPEERRKLEQFRQAILKKVVEQCSEIEPRIREVLHRVYEKDILEEEEDMLLSSILCRIRFYRFHTIGGEAEKPYVSSTGFIDKLRSILKKSILWPPNGTNIGELLTYNRAVRDLVNSIVRELGYERVIYASYERAPAGELVFEKSLSDGRSVLFSTSAVAHGVMVILLTFAALFSNLPEKLPRIVPDVIVLEEPEVHTFPYFTKRIAETIAHVVETESKFVVLTTHNPYVFITLLEKVPLEKLAVYWVYRDKEGYTRYYMLSEDEIREAMSYGTEALFTIEDIVRERLEAEEKTST